MGPRVLGFGFLGRFGCKGWGLGFRSLGLDFLKGYWDPLPFILVPQHILVRVMKPLQRLLAGLVGVMFC